ncbi:MAG: 50S ribosomal protein L5 [Methylacidiphilales bacterium]|nr:50S ribosomal protein L5 [Candidatus Methylacidiphilales bacterium]MDW8348976.1 50S ribosomal protein L5 [Verrucomicrobiae bacterium]
MNARANFDRLYREKIVPSLMESGRYSNINEIPKIEKIVVNCCIGSTEEKTALEDAEKDIAAITGQKPVQTKAKKAISNFKLKKNQPIGLKVTLRGRMMYEFMERLIVMALPRIRDFRGVSARAFDGHGNYTLGIKDHTIFPEIELDKVKRNIGMDITFVTTARNDERAKELLQLFGMPFSDRNRNLQTTAK